MSQKNQTASMFDVRVRERNLKAGTVTEKDLEKYAAQLPDLADQAEPFSIPQPALSHPDPVEAAEHEPAAMANGVE